MQAAILKELITLVRSGKFSSPPSNLVLLGHSFGSVISNAVLSSDPEMVDAAILTGIAYNASGSIPLQAKQVRLAKLANPEKWSKLDGGYAVWVDIFSNIEEYELSYRYQIVSNVSDEVTRFFKVPFYERDVVQYAEDNKAPSALLENLSIGTTNVSSPAFTGPVMVRFPSPCSLEIILINFLAQFLRSESFSYPSDCF